MSIQIDNLSNNNNIAYEPKVAKTSPSEASYEQVSSDVAMTNYGQNSNDNNSKQKTDFLVKNIEEANKTIPAQSNTELHYKIHEKTNKVMVSVVNTSTKEVVREIPSEQALDIFAHSLELAGLNIDEKK